MNELTLKENQKYCLVCGAKVTLDPEDHNYSIGNIPLCELSCRTVYDKAERLHLRGLQLQGLTAIFLIRSAEDYDFSHLLYQQRSQESATA